MLNNRILELENKVLSQNKLNELFTKNVLQFDKNLKTVNEDFSILAASVTQIFQIFSQLKIIKLDKNGGVESFDDFLEPEDPILNKEDQSKQQEKPDIDDFDINNLENINDWDSFKEKHKKKFQ